MLNSQKFSTSILVRQFIFFKKAVVILTSEQWNLSNIVVLSTRMSLLKEVKTRFWGPETVPFPWIEVTNTKMLWTFLGGQILRPLNGGPWIEAS